MIITTTSTPFIETRPRPLSCFRGVNLFGKNSASYKFSLASVLLELAAQERTRVTLEELALPYALHIARHLKEVDKQGTATTSQFLAAIRGFNNREVSEEMLRERTVALGFNNVLDAFHILHNAPIPFTFFEVEKRANKPFALTLTDSLLALREEEAGQFANLPLEVEARWELVERAWQIGSNPQLLEVHYDEDANRLFLFDRSRKRVNLSGCREALNGYQKGKCFYCYRPISLVTKAAEKVENVGVAGEYNEAASSMMVTTIPAKEDEAIASDVDHFFPYTLRKELTRINFNGVWNLVLACSECNRGKDGGKFDRVAALTYLERLHTRNNFFVESHHPLRETILKQTGSTEETRRDFLQKVDRKAISLLIHRWQPPAHALASEAGF